MDPDLAPKQHRSRATQDRIIAAAERLLSDSTMAELSMGQIAKAAGVSVGGVYRRFASKDALERALLERYARLRNAHLSDALDQRRWDGVGLEARVRGVVEALVSLYSENRGVVRAFLLRYWAEPSSLTPDVRAPIDAFYVRMTDLICDACTVESRAEPVVVRERVRRAVMYVSAVCRDVIVVNPPPYPGAIDVAAEDLVDDMVGIVLGQIAETAAFNRRPRQP